MQLIKQISAILLGMIFLVSSSGFLIYKSHCSCTGNKQVSMFVNREICDTPKHNSHEKEMALSCCSSKETQQCQSHLTDSNCNKTEVTYIKLTNKVVKEEVKFTKVEPVVLVVVFLNIQFNLWETDEQVESGCTSIDPPLISDSSLEFLIHIQQLKIPYVA